MNARSLFILSVLVVFSSCATSRGNEQAPAAAAPAEPEFQKFAVKGPKKRIGVLDFENASGQGSAALASVARDAVTEGLVKSGAFVVVEREQIDQVLSEQGLGMSGALSSASIAKASKLLGLQAVVTGKITEFSEDLKEGGFGGYYRSVDQVANARVSLRIIDATTGEIWLADSGEGKAAVNSTTVLGAGSVNQDASLGKRALNGAIRQLMGKIVAKADSKPWTGTVVKVSNDKVYITGGSDTNLAVGTMLNVRHMGEEIKDPGTGQVIGREKGNVIGSLQVAEHLNEKLTACVADAGAGFAIGDVVAVDATPAPTP
jgi:curli biogenesis system outer membrane secretion channel CsgG